MHEAYIKGFLSGGAVAKTYHKLLFLNSLADLEVPSQPPLSYSIGFYHMSPVFAHLPESIVNLSHSIFFVLSRGRLAGISPTIVPSYYRLTVFLYLPSKYD